MNSKHRKTLAAVFKNPVSGTVAWSDIESLLIAAGATVVEGSGSRVRFICKDEAEFFHRPHPERVTDKGAVKSVRRFLSEAGVNQRGIQGLHRQGGV